MATVKTKKPQDRAVAAALALAQQVHRLPASSVWLDYDAEADVLYMSLRRPQKATNTVELEQDGILLRYRGKGLVGVTVLNASKR